MGRWSLQLEVRITLDQEGTRVTRVPGEPHGLGKVRGGGGAADENPEAGAVVMVEEGEEEAETTVEGEEGNRL